MVKKVILCILLPIWIYAAELQKRHGYSVFGDLKYSSDFTHFDYVNPDAPKGGLIRLSSIGPFDSLNPFILKGNKAPGLAMTFDSLLIQSSDEPASVYGLVAESFAFPDDRTYVDFNLRKGAYFHDGSPITAEDLKFSFEILCDKGDPNYKLALEDIDRVEILNDYKVRYHIKNPHNKQVVYNIGGIPVLPKKFFADKDFAKYDHLPILGSGPYKVKAYRFGKDISYQRAKDYWGADLPVKRGINNFDTISYITFYDATMAVEAFKAGEYDYREENVARIWATAYNTDAVAKGRIKKEIIENKIPAPRQFYVMNMRRPDFNDINFRKALNIAFNFEWLNKYLFYSSYKRLESYFENSEFKATGIPEGLELEILQQYEDKLPPELFREEFKFLTNNLDPLLWRENMKKAKALLLEAGYTIKGTLLISPYTKKPVEITILHHSNTFQRVLNEYKSNLAMLGIKLNIRQVDTAQYQERLDTFDFDIITIAFAGSTAPGDEQMYFWHSKSDMKGGYNLAGIHNPVVDSLIEKLIDAANKKEVQAYARALDRVLLWNYYNVLNYYSNQFRILYWDKFDMPETKPSYAVGWETWWSKD